MPHQSKLFVLLLLFLVSSATVAPAQCPSNGLVLVVTTTRLGDAFSLDVFGTPNVSGLIGLDAVGGPISTPIGPVCLGLSPALQLFPFTLDSFGQSLNPGILPANTPLIGASAYLQAAAADLTQPGGLAISNGIHPVLRPPRIFFFHPGYLNPFGSQPGAFCVYDALTDVPVSGAIPLPSSLTDAILMPQPRLIAMLLANSTLLVINADTLVPVLNMPLPGGLGQPLKLGVDGDTLFILYSGVPPSPFSGGIPGGLRTFSMPSGTQGITMQLPSGNPDDFMVLPGTGVAYLRVGTDVVPINLVSGTPMPNIPIGGASGAITEWILRDGKVFCLMAGASPGPFGGTSYPPGINAVDTATHSAILPNPVAFPATPPMTTLRYGPGTAAQPSVFVFNATLGLMAELSSVNFAFLSQFNPGVGLIDMQLTTGGTEWLLLCNGFGCGGVPALLSMTPPILYPTTVTPLVSNVQANLIPLPSTTIRKAFMVLGTSDVAPFPTDSVAAPVSTVPLPLSSGLFKVVVD